MKFNFWATEKENPNLEKLAQDVKEKKGVTLVDWPENGIKTFDKYGLEMLSTDEFLKMSSDVLHKLKEMGWKSPSMPILMYTKQYNITAFLEYYDGKKTIVWVADMVKRDK
jgi:hypothetical protein